MAKLTARKRRHLRSSQFAGPDRSYPIHDKAHARNALARASQQLHAGHLSRAQYDRIVARAHRTLGYGRSNPD